MIARSLSIIAFCLTASTASAAVVPIDLTLEYTGRTFFDVEIRDEPTDELVESFAQLDEADDSWGLERIAGDYAPGERIRFQATVDFADGPGWDFGEMIQCSFGTLSCTGWLVDGGPDLFSTAVDPYASNEGTYLYVTPTIGGIVQRLAPSVDRLAAYVPGAYYALVGDEYASFQVVADNLDAAPIPLPASAALLPLALGGLTLVRRRRAA